MKLEIQDAQKVEILRQLLPQFWNEAVHWRDDSWRFTERLILTFVALATVAYATQGGFLFVALVMSALSIGGSLYLRKNYRNYTDRLRLFVSVEEALLLFEDGVYVEGRSLLPKNLLMAKPKWTGTLVYVVMIWIATLAAWLAVFISGTL